MKIRITQWLWSAWAVLAGFLIANVLGGFFMFPLAILSGISDPADRPFGFQTGIVIVYAIFGLFGGYLTAKVARHHKQGHALALALVLLSGVVFALGAAADLGTPFPWIAIAGSVASAVLAYVGGWLYIKKNTKQESTKKQQNKKLILGHLVEHKRITNNDVEELLGLSDASAGIYLQELEDAGEIEQMGDTGRGVWYRLKK